jgi:hypothetical protein
MVSMVIRIQAGRSCFQILARKINISFLQNVETDPVVNTTSDSMGTEARSRGKAVGFVNLTIHVNLAPRLRTSGVLPPFRSIPSWRGKE